MEIDKVYIKDLFFKADLNFNFAVNIDEINQAESEGNITPEEAGLLREAYGFNKEKNRYSCDPKQDMYLWKYMEAVGKVRHQEIFSKEEIAKLNLYKIFDIIEKNPEYYRCIDDIYKENTEITLQMLACNPKVFNYLYSEQRANKPFILQAIQCAPEIYEYLPEMYNSDVDIAKAAIAASPDIYGMISKNPNFKNDRELALYAVYYDAQNIKNIDGALLKEAGFIEEAFTVNYEIVKFMDEPSEDLKARYVQIAHDINNGLHSLDIEFTERIPASVRKEIIDNRKSSGVDDGRPVALIIYPKTDENGAFITFNNMIAKLVQDGYKVVYYEADSEDDIVKDVQEASQARKIDLFLIGGHGKKDAIQLFSPLTISLNMRKDNIISTAQTLNKIFQILQFIPYPILGLIYLPILIVTRLIDGVRKIFALPFESEKQMLSVNDAKDIKDLSKYMSENSVVILEGCSTGQGGQNAKNLANMLGGVFMNSYIWAPMLGTEIYGFYYDDNGKVNGVNYSVGMPNTYVIQPKSTVNE